jgi:hypothetical protein
MMTCLLPSLLVLLLSAPASAAPPAADEYVLDLPGTEMGPPEGDPSERPGITVDAGGGIVGERNSVPTPLASVRSALLSPSGALLLALPVGLLAGVAVSKRGRR